MRTDTVAGYGVYTRHCIALPLPCIPAPSTGGGPTSLQPLCHVPHLLRYGFGLVRSISPGPGSYSLSPLPTTAACWRSRGAVTRANRHGVSRRTGGHRALGALALPPFRPTHSRLLPAASRAPAHLARTTHTAPVPLPPHTPMRTAHLPVPRVPPLRTALTARPHTAAASFPHTPAAHSQRNNWLQENPFWWELQT